MTVPKMGKTMLTVEPSKDPGRVICWFGEDGGGARDGKSYVDAFKEAITGLQCCSCGGPAVTYLGDPGGDLGEGAGVQLTTCALLTACARWELDTRVARGREEGSLLSRVDEEAVPVLWITKWLGPTSDGTGGKYQLTRRPCSSWQPPPSE